MLLFIINENKFIQKKGEKLCTCGMPRFSVDGAYLPKSAPIASNYAKSRILKHILTSFSKKSLVHI